VTLLNSTFCPPPVMGIFFDSRRSSWGTPDLGRNRHHLGGNGFILGFIETGIVAAGLTGFYTQFFYGLILILALISHRYVGLKRK
jgi:simple sugar transport system permease protein